MYNCPTSPKCVVKDREEAKAARRRITNCQQLTPITEAELDGLPVPSLAEVIEMNSPDYVPNWLDDAEDIDPLDPTIFELDD